MPAVTREGRISQTRKRVARELKPVEPLRREPRMLAKGNMGFRYHLSLAGIAKGRGLRLTRKNNGQSS